MYSKNSPVKERRSKRKVYYAYARRSRKDIIHPVIRLGGIYLREFGFNIGDDIEVSCEKGRIVINKILPDSSTNKKV